MVKKNYKVPYGGVKKGFGVVEGFMNVLAENKKAAQQQVRKKTGKSVYNK